MRRYRPPLKRFLNNFMSSVRHSDEQAIAVFSDLFRRTIRRVLDALGIAAFRLIDANGNAQEKTINRSLFDAQMVIFSWMNDDQGPIETHRLLTNLAQLYQQPAFSELIRRSTGDRSRTRMRVRQLVEAITGAGVALAVPFDLADLDVPSKALDALLSSSPRDRVPLEGRCCSSGRRAEQTRCVRVPL